MSIKTIGKNRKALIDKIFELGKDFESYYYTDDMRGEDATQPTEAKYAKEALFKYDFAKMNCGLDDGRCSVHVHSNHFYTFKVDKDDLNDLLNPSGVRKEKKSAGIRGSPAENLPVEERAKRIEAFSIGKEAFKAGKRRVPSLDAALTKMLEGKRVGESEPILTAWLKGWDVENLKEPVVPSTTTIRLAPTVRSSCNIDESRAFELGKESRRAGRVRDMNPQFLKLIKDKNVVECENLAKFFFKGYDDAVACEATDAKDLEVELRFASNSLANALRNNDKEKIKELSKKICELSRKLSG